jgi:hypothetical protein
MSLVKSAQRVADHGEVSPRLTCIANLSNDEVFTPPELANRRLRFGGGGEKRGLLLFDKAISLLLWLRTIGQHASRSVYTWVPVQTWDREWTDEELYKKYGLSQEQVEYIEFLIKPMEIGTAAENE